MVSVRLILGDYPILGSGQTARGALRFNHKCVGYDTKYLDLAHERLYEAPQYKYPLLPKMERQEVIL